MSPKHARGRGAARLPADVIDRPRLREILDGPSALTIVSGPAGSGKTTLLAQWAHAQSEMGLAVIQVAFGPEITNPHMLWHEALAQLAPHDLVADAAGLIEDVRGFDSLRDPMATVHRVFDELRAPCVLTIDNGERADEVPFLEEIVRLLDHAAELRVIVSTRRSLTAKRLPTLAGTDTAFIGPADLLFTDGEAREVIEGMIQQPVPPDSIGPLTALPISARMVGLTIRARQWPLASGSGRESVGDALMSRLIAEEAPADFREFLLCTSLPSIVTGEIAERLGWGATVDAHLERAEQLGLGMWEAIGDAVGFVYTPVLREALVRHIEQHSPAEVRRLRRTVAIWAFEHRQQLEALSNALAAKDHHLASRLVRTSWFVLSQTCPEDVVALLKRQGPVILTRFPVLSTAMALMLVVLGHRLRALGYFQSAVLSSQRRGGADDDRTERLWTLSVQTLAERFASQFERAEASSLKVRDVYLAMSEAERAASENTLALLLSNCGIGLLYAGRLDEAVAVLEWGMNVQVPDDDGGWYHCASTLAGIQAVRGRLHAARRVLEEIDAANVPLYWRTDLYGILEQIAHAYLALAEVDLDRAQRHLDSIAYHLGTAEHWPFLVCAQSDILLLSGRGAEALRVIDAALERGVNPKTSRTAMNELSRRRMLALLSLGNVTAFDRGIETIEPPVVRRALRGFRALLAGQPDVAVTALGSIAMGMDAIDDHGLQVHVLLVFAVAMARLGRRELARQACEQAAAMLKEEHTRAALMMFSHAELHELRAVVEGVTRGFFDAALADIPDRGAAYDLLPSPPHLTLRERAVLGELVRTASTTAIAEALFVSPNTVKVQRRSVYRKLAVSSREEALVRAAELGLLGDA